MNHVKLTRLSSSGLESSALTDGGLSITPGRSSSRTGHSVGKEISVLKRPRDDSGDDDLDLDAEEEWISTATLPRRQPIRSSILLPHDSEGKRLSGCSPSRQLRFSAELEATPLSQLLSQAMLSEDPYADVHSQEGILHNHLTVSKETNLRDSRVLPSPTSPLWGSSESEISPRLSNTSDTELRRLELLEDSLEDGNSFSATQEAEALESFGSRSLLLRPAGKGCTKDDMAKYVEATNAFFLMIDQRPMLTTSSCDKHSHAATFGQMVDDTRRSLLMSLSS